MPLCISYDMTEHEKAKRWLEKVGLTVDDLADMTGYGRRSVYWMLRGESPPNGTRSKPAKVAPWVWQRFKMACAGAQAQIQSSEEFDW